MTFLKRRHKRTPLFCTHKKRRRRRRRRERLSRSAHKFVFLYHHTITFANSTGERASHRRRERGLNRAKTRSTRAVWRRRERFRGRKIINHIRLLGIFRRDDDDINQCAIESTYNNRNRKRLLKNGVETNHERACGAWCCYYFRAGKTSFVFFLASESSRTGRVASRARGLDFAKSSLMSSFLFGIFFFSPSKESSFLSSLFMRPHVARENFGDDDDDDDDDVPKTGGHNKRCGRTTSMR